MPRKDSERKRGARAQAGRPTVRDRKAFLLRLPPDLMEELRSWANQELRSLNAHIEYLLREGVRRRRGR